MADNSPKCKNDAFCYPCLQDNDKDSIANACNDEEFKQGFRCICPPGYSGTFCARKIGPCDSNHCKNNAKCVPSSNDTFDYRFVIEFKSLLFFFALVAYVRKVIVEHFVRPLKEHVLVLVISAKMAYAKTMLIIVKAFIVNAKKGLGKISAKLCLFYWILAE